LAQEKEQEGEQQRRTSSEKRISARAEGGEGKVGIRKFKRPSRTNSSENRNGAVRFDPKKTDRVAEEGRNRSDQAK